jgi:hypothetical protein
MTRNLAFLLAMHKRTLIEVLPIRQSDQAFFRYCSATIPLLFRCRSVVVPQPFRTFLLDYCSLFSATAPRPFLNPSATVPYLSRIEIRKTYYPPSGGMTLPHHRSPSLSLSYSASTSLPSFYRVLLCAHAFFVRGAL